MTEKQILDYALKGVLAEIDVLDKQIRQVREVLSKIENGEPVRIKKTAFEVRSILEEKNQVMEKLLDDKNQIKWKMTEIQ